MKLDKLRKLLNINDNDFKFILKRLKREPNEVELTLFSACFSEHCGYRHSKKYLKNLYRKNAVHTSENAGGIIIGDHTICFKTESHNHPSAVEPFNGAATGIGGIIRDVLAMNARPILLADSLKFGNLKNPHTKYLFENVVNGISFYGNCTGIPTITGETDFDDRFEKNPIINVFALGIGKTEKITTSKAVPDKKIMLIGSKTMRDGAGGAVFASKELTKKEQNDNRFCIQIADPFTKKKLIETTLKILEKGLAIACQDCGAAGILSSTSEIAAKSNCGVELDLDTVHLGDSTMNAIDIMLSETQERMIIVYEEQNFDEIKKILEMHELEFSIIGQTTHKKKYILKFNGKTVANLPVAVLTAAPFVEVKAQKTCLAKQSPKPNEKLTAEKIFNFIKNPNFASKEWIFSQYDYTVGARTAIPPQDKGIGAVWLWEENCFLGVTLHSDFYKVFINPFEGTLATMAQARRKLIAAGFTPKGYTNCLNFPNPEKGEVIYSFTECLKGMNYAARKFDVPVVSGNVSFYNEFQNFPVYSTPMIGMIGDCPTQEQITKSFFELNETVFVIGKKQDEKSAIGGSVYFVQNYNYLGETIDRVNIALETKLEKFFINIRKTNLLKTALAPNKGGIFGAIFKGLVKNNLGFKFKNHQLSNSEYFLFGETETRYIIGTHSPELMAEILNLHKIPFTKLGKTTNENIQLGELEIDKSKAFEAYQNAFKLDLQSKDL